jgi:hypothetical protein
MHKLILLLPLFTVSTYAQSAPDPANPMSTWLRNAYTGNRNNIVRTADKMPEENYGMRPGAQPEEKNPNPGNLDKLTSKAEILKVLNDAFSYCDSAYSGLTDASGAEVIDITQENGRQTRNLRMGLLTLNYGHNNEIYGSMVVYLRMKNIVPPASEPRPQQKK